MNRVNVEVCCIQCELKKAVESLEAGGELPEPVAFPGTWEEHLAQHHPDPVACQAERDELERRMMAEVKRRRARQRAAHSN